MAQPLPVASGKRVVDPADESTTPPTPAAKPEEPKKLFRFIKNDVPFEKLTFKDGSEFALGKSLFVTSDEALAAKIREVAGQYRILEQNQP